MKTILLVSLIFLAGCASTPEIKKAFEKYQVAPGASSYKGTVVNEYHGGQRHDKVDWWIDGSGRAITAAIVVDNKLVCHRVFSYDTFFEFIRKRNHKKEMTNAMTWIQESLGVW